MRPLLITAAADMYGQCLTVTEVRLVEVQCQTHLPEDIFTCPLPLAHVFDAHLLLLYCCHCNRFV